MTDVISAIQYLDPVGQPPWLWRGQADQGFGLVPGLHSALQNNGIEINDDNVVLATTKTLKRARLLGLDTHEGTRLPDLALLARLQHYGVATPLLDVTVDPLVALYMTAVEPDGSTATAPGILFGIPRWVDLGSVHSRFGMQDRSDREGHGQLDSYDDRPFLQVYESVKAYVATANPDDGAPVMFYAAPAITDRLAIQRGYFVLGCVADDVVDMSQRSTIRGLRFQDDWIKGFMAKHGLAGSPGAGARPSDPSALIQLQVPGADFRTTLRAWIEPRSGLTTEVVYPPAWHEPHLEAWAKRNGRNGLRLDANDFTP